MIHPVLLSKQTTNTLFLYNGVKVGCWLEMSPCKIAYLFRTNQQHTVVERKLLLLLYFKTMVIHS